jgi:hypothetical protein
MPDLIQIKKMEIFKKGRHVSSDGEPFDAADSVLDSIVSNFNADEYKPPVVVGHPKMDDPRYGDTLKVYREGNSIFADVGLIPEFYELVKKGMYPDRSVRLAKTSNGWKLKHIGFLGAEPPAVKGLAPIQFSDGDDGVTIEFADYRVNAIGNIFQRLREWLIEKFGADTADKVVSSWEIDDWKRQLEPEAETASAFNEGGLDMDKIQELETKLKEKETALSEFAERDKAKEDEIARLKKELEEEKANQRKAEFNAFCEGLIKEGKLTPAMKPAVLDFMEIMSNSGEFEFSEGDDKKVKAQPVEKFKAFLNALPKQVEFSELATKQKAAEGKGKDAGHDFSGKVDEERLELHQKAMEFMEKEGISYRDAVKKALKEE